MMQKQIIFLLLSLVYIVNSYYEDDQQDYSSCKRYENKIYLVTVTFPGKTSFNCGLRLLPNYMFDEIFSIGGGNNAAELGASFALSTRYGKYKCLPRNYMRLTGFGFLYKTDDVSFLNVTGANVIHDYYFRFYNSYKTCKGVVKFAVFTTGTNPFTTKDQPVSVGDIGQVTCELLEFRTYYKLSGV